MVNDCERLDLKKYGAVPLQSQGVRFSPAIAVYGMPVACNGG